MMKWQKDNRENHYLFRRKIQLARIWKRPDGHFQIAIDLPLLSSPQHLHPSLKLAKHTVNETVTEWFEAVL